MVGETCHSVQEPLLEQLQTLETKQDGQNHLREAEPPVETQAARREVRVRAPGEVRREEKESHICSMLDRLTTLESIEEAREPINPNYQLQQRILEEMRFL